jgi:hypothetical protein
VARTAKFQLTLEERERINRGLAVRVPAWGGVLKVKSLRHKNPNAFQENICIIELDGKEIRVSASALIQALNSA